MRCFFVFLFLLISAGAVADENSFVFKEIEVVEPIDAVLNKVKLAYQNEDIALLADYTHFPLQVSLDINKSKLIKNKEEMLKNKDLIFNRQMQRVMGCLSKDKVYKNVTGYTSDGQPIEFFGEVFDGNKKFKVKYGLSLISSNDPNVERFIDDMCGVIGEWERRQWLLVKPVLESVKQAYANQDIVALSDLAEYPFVVTLLGESDDITYEEQYMDVVNKGDFLAKKELIFNPVMMRFVSCLTPSKMYRYRSFKSQFRPQDFFRPVLVNGVISKYVFKGMTTATEHNQYIDEICRDVPDPRPIH